MRIRHFVALYLLVATVWAAAPAMAERLPVISGARVGVHPESTRLVFEMDRAVPYKIFTLADPFRIVIDFPEVFWRVSEARMRTAAGLVSRFRFGLFQPGNSRVVVDVKAPATVTKHFILPPKGSKPRRFVVDLKPVTRDAFFAGARSAQSKNWSKQKRPASVSGATPKPKPKRSGDRRRVIVLDPGHGGVDPGTVGVTGSYEKHITLAVAKAAKKVLEASGRYRVVLTRTRDVYVRLRDRFEIAHNNKAEMFISLHADSIGSRKIRGGSIYTLSDKASDKEAEDLANKENKSDIIAGADLTGYASEVSRVLIDLAQNDTNRESWHLAKMLVGELKKKIKLLRTSHRYAGFAVLKSPNVPSALIELGYLSNRTDEKNLKSPRYRKGIGQALLRAADRYFARKELNNRS
ncbi:MAG: N-acetylmuramoyl-L-alanine amidase [Rhodospirillaceae bacterium]|nr:N-acetylmuramoyl-L-alanine amidase [Rhodospirillaceae bacterium]